MGLFGKKKTAKVSDKEEEEKVILKTELESKVEKLQKEFREKQVELDDITQKITTVKKEYDLTISNIMLVKKELNQKRMELDIVKREYKESIEKNKKLAVIKDTEKIGNFKKTEGEHSKIKEELAESTKKYKEIKEKIAQEQSILHNTTKQQVKVKKELEEANYRLYNAKEELNKKDTFEDTSALTSSEKEFMGVDKGNQKSSAGIIEAASVVVGSLKSKLNTKQKELDTIQTLLEKEREEHQNTRKELEELKSTTREPSN